MKRLNAIGFSLLVIFFQGLTTYAQSGFISIDCGAASSYTDQSTNISWVPDTGYTYGGVVANLSQSVTDSRPLQTLRYFTGTQSKYCFNLGPVNVSSRYLVRATFLYGKYDGANAYPIFSISVDASQWANVTIGNASQLYFKEFIAVATNSTSFVVCLIRGATGSPFISTLELRPLTDGMYSLPYLGTSFMTMAARINFGAPSAASVRYPDDPTDRIWVSDKVWPLQGKAAGTQNISTDNAVDVTTTRAVDIPAEKVMQTAVIGTQGDLSYRLNLAGFPASCYAVLYFAEIEQLEPGDIRSFNFVSNINSAVYNGQPLNLVRDVGAFTAFETGFNSAVIPQIVDFSLVKTNDSNYNPILNALEIYQILPVVARTDASDVAALSLLTGQLPRGESLGDPCLPVPWDFLTCSSDSPPRVANIDLSGRNLTGNIPEAIGGMIGLTNLWLDNNQLNGDIPDLSQLTGLNTLHLQNNYLSGPFPSSLAGLDNLTELFLNNNNLTGSVPSSLLDKKDLLIQASGNPYLCANISCAGHSNRSVSIAAVVGGSVGGAILLILLTAVIGALLWRHHKNRRRIKKDSLEGSHFPFQQSSSVDFRLSDEGDPTAIADGARLFQISELVAATEKFSKMIGSGGYGPVYYGKTKDDQEIAVKVLSASSNQGAKEFFNEVNLLSRAHHRNLVTLIGYCPDIKERMLIYEYMHKGSLRDHLHGPLSDEEPVDWLARLHIVLDAAKGLEYLHTGCNPSIIHRDVKSSNILINKKLIAKVADFGLSKLTTEDVSVISTTIRGTVGYLDPEYYVSQQLTTKSDVFSFGVVLLEIISGREPIIVNQPYSNLVSWSRALLQKGDIQSMVDPALGFNFRMESLWKLAELALRSVEPSGKSRPTMSQIVLELVEIIDIEMLDSAESRLSTSDSFQGFSLGRPRSHSPSGSYGFDSSSMAPMHSGSLADSYNEPGLR